MTKVHTLVPIFASYYAAGSGGFDAAPESVEIALRRLLATAEEAWPNLELPESLFVKHVAQRLHGQPSVSEALASLHASDLYLACACCERQSRALILLDQRFLRQVPTWVSRIRADPSFSDDVGQTLREKLLVGSARSPGKISEYSGRGPLLSWLRVSALRVAIDIHRKTHPVPVSNPAEQEEQFLRIAPSAEIAYIKARYQGLLGQALIEALSSLSDEEHNLVRLYYSDGLSMEQVAAIFGVNRSTIKRRLDDTCSRLLTEIKRCLRQHIQLTSAQLRSLVNQLLSRFEMPALSR